MAPARKPQISAADRTAVGRSLRELRRAAGFRSVETAAGTKGCPASRQTIYQYERGGLTPSLAQFLELVSFYVLDAERPTGGKPDDDLRAHGVAAVALALELPLYHVTEARALMAAMRPGGAR
jgi:transcriptional regulator with XRE-family HTH domain